MTDLMKARPQIEAEIIYNHKLYITSGIFYVFGQPDFHIVTKQILFSLGFILNLVTLAFYKRDLDSGKMIPDALFSAELA
jgi:hypothetical protein